MTVTATGPQGASPTASAGQPVLEARDLTKVFGTGPGTIRAVDDLDLTVHAGEIVALLGPNGAARPPPSR